MQVKAQVGEVFMVYGSCEVAYVVVFVVDAEAVDKYFVVDECDGVVAQGIGGVERGDGGMAVDAQSACQVDGVKWSCQSR